jgi:uncharacterized protein YegP (UPF0339 family)
VRSSRGPVGSSSLAAPITWPDCIPDASPLTCTVELVVKAVLFRDNAGEYRFRLVAENGEVIAASEGYVRRIDAERAAADLADEVEVESDEL